MFVTCCTANRYHWLNHSVIHDAFRLFCAQSPARVDVWVGKYVLMPDHLHVFVSTEGSVSLSKWVHSLKGHLAAVRRKAGCGDKAWQTGFFDHVLRGNESYGEKWDYVRMNPVRAGLVSHADEWPYAGEIELLKW